MSIYDLLRFQIIFHCFPSRSKKPEEPAPLYFIDQNAVFINCGVHKCEIKKQSSCRLAWGTRWRAIIITIIIIIADDITEEVTMVVSTIIVATIIAIFEVDDVDCDGSNDEDRG